MSKSTSIFLKKLANQLNCLHADMMYMETLQLSLYSKNYSEMTVMNQFLTPTGHQQSAEIFTVQINVSHTAV